MKREVDDIGTASTGRSSERVVDVPRSTPRDGPLFPWRSVVAPWLVSRLLVLPTILIGARGRFGGRIDVDAFRLYDGGWYAAIAQHGYGVAPLGDVQTRWPFFPGLPGIWRAFMEVGLGGTLPMVALNSAVLLVALAGLHRLAARHVSARAAHLCIWSLALFPVTAVFTLVYPSAIFLAAGVWAFLLVEDHRDLGASAAVLAAAMIRPNGLVLALAVALAIRSPRRIAVVCGPALVAVGVWCLLCWRWTGDPFVFYSTKAGWEEVTIVELFTGVHRQAMPHVALAAVAMAVVVMAWRRLPPAWLAYTALALVPSFLLGMVGLGRYANQCFPVFVAGGTVLERTPVVVQRSVLTLSGVGTVLFTLCIVRWNLTP